MFRRRLVAATSSSWSARGRFSILYRVSGVGLDHLIPCAYVCFIEIHDSSTISTSYNNSLVSSCSVIISHLLNCHDGNDDNMGIAVVMICLIIQTNFVEIQMLQTSARYSANASPIQSAIEKTGTLVPCPVIMHISPDSLRGWCVEQKWNNEPIAEHRCLTVWNQMVEVNGRKTKNVRGEHGILHYSPNF